MKNLIYILLFICSISFAQNSFDESYYHEDNVDLLDELKITKRDRDRTRKIQRFLDSKRKTKAPQGRFLITKTLIQTVNKDIDWTGCMLYTKDNIDVLIIRSSWFSHWNLYINTSLVENPTPDKRLITLQFKNINQQWNRFVNLRLVGSEVSLVKKVGAGHTGLFSDSTTDADGTLITDGEKHRLKVDAFLKGLNTGILFSHLPEHNTRVASNSEHEFILDGIGCKQLIVFENGAGSGSNLTFRYQNREVLLRGEEHLELVKLNSDFITVSNPKLYDEKIGRKFRNRLGIEIIGHSTMIGNYKQHNVLMDYPWKWYTIKEHVKMIKPLQDLKEEGKKTDIKIRNLNSLVDILYKRK